jgi:dipeptide/tripeptide permease
MFGVVDLTTAVGVASASGVIIVALSLSYFGYMFVAGGLDPVEKKRLGVIVILFFFSAIFWSGFEQAGSSLNLFARDLTDRVIGGWEMPASWLQSVNSIFIIALAPVFRVVLGMVEPPQDRAVQPGEIRLRTRLPGSRLPRDGRCLLARSRR